MSGRMFERPIRTLLASLGFELLPREALERERLASARTTEALELRLKQADEERASLRAEAARLQDAMDGAVADLWAKVDKERRRAVAAAAEARRNAAATRAAQSVAQAARADAETARGAAQAVGAKLEAARAKATVAQNEVRAARARAEAAQAEAEAARAEAQAAATKLDAARAKTAAFQQQALDARARAEDAEAVAEAARAEALAAQAAPRSVAGRQQIEALRVKLNAESEMKAAIKQRLREQTSLTDALELANRTYREDLRELEDRLAVFESGATRKVGDDLLSALGAFPARRSDLVSDRLVESLLKRSGLKARGEDDAASYYRLGRNLQVQGASELAAAAYRKVGPGIAEFLARPGPDGRPVSGPDFLIIGAPRAGTTWLKRALSHHPDVMMFAGEPQFFAMTSHLGPDEYVKRFSATGARFLRRDRKERTPMRPQQPVMGEKSTTYLSMSEAQISLCAALYPKARIVCLIRDPVARAWSHIKHDGFGHFGEHPQKLYEQPYWQSLPAYIRHGQYARHLGRWARRYPPEQIHLVDFNRLATDADAVYREVLDHIGATTTPDLTAPERVHHSKDSAPPDRLKAILERAYADARYDIPHLRSVMAQAAEEGRQRRRQPKRRSASAGAESPSVAAE